MLLKDNNYMQNIEQYRKVEFEIDVLKANVNMVLVWLMNLFEYVLVFIIRISAVHLILFFFLGALYAMKTLLSYYHQLLLKHSEESLPDINYLLAVPFLHVSLPAYGK